MTTLQQSSTDTISILTVKDPAAGHVVEIGAGNRLDLRFSHTGLASRWEVVERPRNLVPLAVGRTSFSFLAFRSDVPVQELVLRRTGGVRAGETARRSGSAFARDYAVELPRLAGLGVMRPHISHRFPMERAADAFRALIDRKVVGKAVILMSS